MRKSLLQPFANRLTTIFTTIKKRRNDWINRALIVFYGSVLVQKAYAGILSTKICTAYNAIFDNAFVGAVAMFAFTIMFLKWKFSDKSSEAMGTGFKIAICLTGLTSLATILGWFGVSPC